MNNETQLLIGLSIANLFMNLVLLICILVVLFRKRKPQETSEANEFSTTPTLEVNSQSRSSKVVGVVFCRNCGKQYDSSLSSCPHCSGNRM